MRPVLDASVAHLIDRGQTLQMPKQKCRWLRKVRGAGVMTLTPLLFSISLAAQEKGALKSIPKNKLAMVCYFDQWEVTPYGERRNTHMICTKRDGTKEAWMRVPDHSTSTRRDFVLMPVVPADSVLTAPAQIPEVKSSVDSDEDYDDDNDMPSKRKMKETRPK